MHDQSTFMTRFERQELSSVGPRRRTIAG